MCRLFFSFLYCGVSNHCSKFRGRETEASASEVWIVFPGQERLVAIQSSYSRLFLKVLLLRVDLAECWRQRHACSSSFLSVAFIDVTIFSFLHVSPYLISAYILESMKKGRGLFSVSRAWYLPDTQRWLSIFSVWYTLHSALSVSGGSSSTGLFKAID